MKLTPSKAHNRFPVVEDIPESRLSRRSKLQLDIRYNDKDPQATIDKAVCLDNVVIPEIIKRFNAHEELTAALKELRDAAMNTPALDDSDEWTQLIKKADAIMEKIKS